MEIRIAIGNAQGDTANRLIKYHHARCWLEGDDE